MDVTVRGNNLKISEGVEEFTEERVAKLSRYLPNIASVQVDFVHQKSNRGPDMISAQITLRHSRGAILRAEERVEVGGAMDGNPAKNALVGALEKMNTRIMRFKGKRRDKRLRDAFKLTMEEMQLAEDLPMDAEAEAEANGVVADAVAEEIIRRKMVTVSPMNEEEAIEQMELLGHAFFLYVNPISNQVNVVYKRRSGGYGLLEPALD
jgi:putative sigma-54 modulation protein